MGAWSFLKHAQREANLRASLDEYLRFGLEAGLLFVTKAHFNPHEGTNKP
jgi:hypothetical protein